MAGLKPQELLIILVILLVLFGGSQLPKLARNLGQAQKEFKKGIDDGLKSDKSDGEPSDNHATPKNTTDEHA